MLHRKQKHITTDTKETNCEYTKRNATYCSEYIPQPVINLQLSLRHTISTVQDTIPRCEVFMLSSRRL